MALVLVVDDEPDIRELVRMNLELDGHTVVTAEDGPSGLEAVKRERPDVVLLDVMMPGFDGWEVLSRLKGTDGGEPDDTPVVMLTALAGEMDRIRGGIEGAVHYLTKPFGIEELRAQVRAAIEGSEPEKRRQAQSAALGRLAEVESGRPRSDGPRPRLSRLENTPEAPAAPSVPSESEGPLSSESLTEKQLELVRAVAASETVRQAAQDLGVSRSNVYASLRRVARKLGVASVPELVKRARAGDIDSAPPAG